MMCCPDPHASGPRCLTLLIAYIALHRRHTVVPPQDVPTYLLYHYDVTICLRTRHAFSQNSPLQIYVHECELHHCVHAIAEKIASECNRKHLDTNNIDNRHSSRRPAICGSVPRAFHR